MTQRSPNAMLAYANYDIRRRSVDVTLLYESVNGTQSFVQTPLVRTVQPTEHEVVAPTFALTPDDATRLMDALWSAHVRPTSMPQSTAGEIEALKYTNATLTSEVDFLRTLVKHHLGIV
jgi:hypothetical protein